MNDYADAFDLKQGLINKSVQAYVLALETINRLSIQYRLEAFCYLICNAWELLLKAKIIEDDGSEDVIYYNRQDENQRRRSLSLEGCLKKVKPNPKDPVRRNIEWIIELRNESTHLVISQIPSELMMLFQASVVNYHKHLNEWFGESLSDKFPIGMMSIVYDLNPGQVDLTDNRLRRKLGKDAAAFLTQYCGELKDEFDSLQRSAEFSIGLEYRLVLTKNPGEADIELSPGPKGDNLTQIVQVPKDPGTSHPFRQKEVLEQLKSKIPNVQINKHDLKCVNAAYNVKSRPEYFYKGKVKGSPSQYSQAFVEWLARQKPDFFMNARQLYKNTQMDKR